MKKIFILLATIFFFNINVKAQDDPNIGFYVDGVKVNELTCYTFGRLTVVLSNNPAYAKYDRLYITIKTKYKKVGVIEIPTYSTKHSKGKYFVYDLWVPNKQNAVYKPKDGSKEKNGEYEVNPTRGYLAYYTGSTPTGKLTFTLGGSTISGYTEEYDAGCSCVMKKPTYSDSELETLELKLSNQESKKKFTVFEGIQMDLSQPCTYPGIKVDFNSLK